MIAQAVVISEQKVLMVRQHVQRGDIVWNFPGGNVENNESPVEACVREVKEETGYDIEIIRKVFSTYKKNTYTAKVIGGSLGVDHNLDANGDIVEAKWIELEDKSKFDSYTTPILNLINYKYLGGCYGG